MYRTRSGLPSPHPHKNLLVFFGRVILQPAFIDIFLCIASMIFSIVRDDCAKTTPSLQNGEVDVIQGALLISK